MYIHLHHINNLKTKNMTTLKFSKKVIIAGLKENIARIESQLKSNYYQKGYVQNCKATIESYKLQITNLESN